MGINLGMTAIIVHSDEPIALFGGGDATSDVIDRVRKLTSAVVAADGGANLALDHNIKPDAVIGDFDSVSPDTVAALPDHALHKIEEQDSTDFDKALRRISAPLILAVGFTGARLDHQLAAMHTLVARADKRCIVLSDRELVFVCPPRLSLSLPKQSVFSLFPMGQVEGTSKGLKWPIDGLVFTPASRIGTSNEVSGKVELTVDAPSMLAIVPISELDAVMDALLTSGVGWESKDLSAV